MRERSDIGHRLAVFLILLVGPGCSFAQQIGYRSASPEPVRPNPPAELRLGTMGSDGTVSLDRPSYFDILTELKSADAHTRLRAARKLYAERSSHYYYIGDLVASLESEDEAVLSYVSFVLLDAIVAAPYRSVALTQYVEYFRQLYWNARDMNTRANSVALLAMSTSEFQIVQPVVVDAVSKGDGLILHNAAIAIQSFAPPSVELFKLLTNRLRKEDPDSFPVANAMTKIASVLSAGDEGFSADRLLEGSRALAGLGGFEEQARYIELAAQRIRVNYVRTASLATNSTQRSFLFDAALDAAPFESASLEINGERPGPMFLIHDGRGVTFLGERSPLQLGLNMLRSAAMKTYVWLEGQTLKRFESPYKNSYAVIVAVDKYDEAVSAATRAKYRTLGNMVPNARMLGKTLESNGFSREHIFFLFDDKATSKSIGALLEEFWAGGKYQNADRLVFYFAGHGDYIERAVDTDPSEHTGFLITTDFDSSMPTRTGLLLRDLTGRHFENIVARHVLMLIDSCSAGLALPRFQSSNLDQDTLSRFRQYSTIDAEAQRPARNTLVAGTGRQDALWENGGIFTLSLLHGIAGDADFNHDRIVEFDELALFSKEFVRTKAASTGFEQEPAAFKATAYGKGSVLLIRE
jgi:hypothetical protein